MGFCYSEQPKSTNTFCREQLTLCPVLLDPVPFGGSDQERFFFVFCQEKKAKKEKKEKKEKGEKGEKKAGKRLWREGRHTYFLVRG